jgi:glycosyltransferase involved in cell wall biosynthesis
MLDPWFNQADRLKYFRKLFFWSTLEQRAVAKARAILFTCEEERLLAGKSFKPYSPRAEAVAGLGIAIPAGLGEGPQPISFKFPVLEGRRYILFLGRIDPKKGCELLIQAFSEVPNDCTLVIAGPDSCGLSPRLRELASALGISDRVVFTGPLYGPDKWSALRNAELFVLPSFQEAFPVACLEALSVGLPILTTRGVNIWREIEEGGASIVTEATLAGIRSGLERWFCLPAPLRNEMASNAKFLFDSKYEVSRAAMNQYRVIERHL